MATLKKKVKEVFVEEEEVVEKKEVSSVETHTEYDPSIPENKQRHLR